MVTERTYIINTDENARARLSLQHTLYSKGSLELLALANVTEGMHGLEIGCGAGDMTIHLADLVGPAGKLTSIDINDEQIAAARARLNNPERVEFKNHSISELSALGHQFDFIYCRMVLHHLADAAAAMAEMVRCLKANACVIIEEPAMHEGSFCYPSSPEIDQFITWTRECFVRNARNYNIALSMHEVIAGLTCKISHYSLNHPVLISEEQKQIYPMSLVDLTPQMIKHGIASAAELHVAHQELQNFIKGQHLLTWLRMHQLVARKS